MALRFTLKEFGRTFATLERAQELRRELLDRAGDIDEIVLDFTGVSNVSYSFADEFAGVLTAEGSADVKLANTTDAVRRTLERAVGRRAPSALVS